MKNPLSTALNCCHEYSPAFHRHYLAIISHQFVLKRREIYKALKHAAKVIFKVTQGYWSLMLAPFDRPHAISGFIVYICCIIFVMLYQFASVRDCM